jgi:predicted ATPase
MHDPRMARQYAERVIVLSTEHGFPFELALGTFCRGWALAHEGHLEEGIAEMRRAKVDLEALRFARPRWLAFLAEACARAFGPGTGLELLAEGLALVQLTRERYYEAELYRLRGQLLLMQGAPNASEAAGCFRTAIKIARRQGGR